jgi:mannose-6-phosphate isomerase-like protein (cupin superfamily)
MRRIIKPWGYEELVEHNDRYVVKRLFMKKGHRCSLQYHRKKIETVMILKGKLELFYRGRMRHMRPFDAVTIRPGEKHRMEALNGDCMYLECSTPELDDVVRLEDLYGRLQKGKRR